MRHRPLRTVRAPHGGAGVVAFPPPFYIPAATTAGADGDSTRPLAVTWVPAPRHPGPSCQQLSADRRGPRQSNVAYVRRASASCSALGCLPPARRQRPAGAHAKTPGSVAPVRRDGHVLVLVLESGDAPRAPAWCAFGSGQECHGLMAGWFGLDGRIQRDTRGSRH